MNLPGLETNQLKTVELCGLLLYCYNLSSYLAYEDKSKTRPIIFSFITQINPDLTKNILFLYVYFTVFSFKFSLNFQII